MSGTMRLPGQPCWTRLLRRGPRRKTVLDRAEKARSAINASIGRLEKFRNSNRGKAAGNETVQELLKDADDNIKKYRESYLPSVEGLLKDSTLTRLAGDTG